MKNGYMELAAHLAARRGAIMQAWRERVRQDPTLVSGSSMPRSELNDHIPGMLLAFERKLRQLGGTSQEGDALQPPREGEAAGLPLKGEAEDTFQEVNSSRDNGAGDSPQHAAAHGLHRWQQGYDLREVTCELGRLNECVVAELEAYQRSTPMGDVEVMASARQVWAAACTEGISASAAQYYRVQQLEAEGHVFDLENALQEVRELERRRAELWQQAAHDLRGNLGVVANATAGLASGRAPASAQEAFLRLLQRNVASLHNLLDDVTSLARLQAGRETRRVSRVDVAAVLQELCEGLQTLARQKGLFLEVAGPATMAVEADEVKIRRLAQNLLLNAIKFTKVGGVRMSWGDSDAGDAKRWALTITDSGPGLPSRPPDTMVGALEAATNLMSGSEPNPQVAVIEPAGTAETGPGAGRDQIRPSPAQAPGEGIGLSIVKRLCELLDATMESGSAEGGGTTFRILLPREYPPPV